MKKIILIFAIIASLVGCSKKDDNPAPIKYELVSAFDGIYSNVNKETDKLTFKVTSPSTALLTFNYSGILKYEIIEIVGTNSTSFTGIERKTGYDDVKFNITFQGTNNNNIIITSPNSLNFNGIK